MWAMCCPEVKFASPATGLSGLRDLRNSITLAQVLAVAALLTRYRSFQLQFKLINEG
jgi:hypothetical protein